MSATYPAPKPGFRINGWHVLGGVTAFFAVVIAVDVLFTVLAVRTFPGQVSVTPYEDGLLYNKRIAQEQAQTALGWRAAAEAQPGLVALTLRDAEGRPLRGLAVTGRLERPATEADRRQPRFVETAPGRYEGTTGAIDGAWDLTAEAVDAQGRRFIAERRLTWP
ncbi:FixH family protein [Phenylobacterium sp. J426]|uniref:FixH family protein n=1 Tax=Phenylobacterium sp. J426 TaxID=2898439 RepID=UPI002151DAF5|nr:FixH family protein [Phenylobacterium sp. J426]MCR5876434.1 FixH family protein [Phenylobacterium sp. J426]